ncbi:MAG: hypothetical protein KKG97_05775, partial [Proteobacteria bacterium]|nr:hypothetical protein [Pseudomonadota bacterium]
EPVCAHHIQYLYACYFSFCFLSLIKLYELIEKYPDVAKHLFKVIASRLDRADKIMVRLINERKQKEK